MVLRVAGHGEEAWPVLGSTKGGAAVTQKLEPDEGPPATALQPLKSRAELPDTMLGQVRVCDFDAAVFQVRGTFLELASSEVPLPLTLRLRRSWSDSDLQASADLHASFSGTDSPRERNDTDSTGDIGNVEAQSSTGSWLSAPGDALLRQSSAGSWLSAAGDQGASGGETEASEEDVIDLTTVEPHIQQAQMETKWNLNAAEWRPATIVAPAAAPEPVPAAVQQHPPAALQAEPAGDKTTIVLRRLPAAWIAGGRTAILEVLDELGFEGLYDFMYAPADIQDLQSKGYAFVNFLTVEAAEQAVTMLREIGEQAPTVGWSDLQGLARHIARYRDSPIMHKSVPEEIQPILFKDGARIPFPSPQGQVRRPCLSRRKPRPDE